MTALIAQNYADEWLETGAAGQHDFIAGSSGVRLSLGESYCTSLSGSVGCSSGTLSKSLSRSGNSSGATSPHKSPRGSAPQRAQQMLHRELAAPVPFRAADATGAANLLRSYSSFDGLEGPNRHLVAAAAAATGAAGTPPRSGPPPEVLLAALSASLAAQQKRQQEAAPAPQLPAPNCAPAPTATSTKTTTASATAAPVPPAFTCGACSCAFVDAGAYQQHCSSMEHTLNILQSSLALGAPRVAAHMAGLTVPPCIRSHSQGPPMHAPAALAHDPPVGAPAPGAGPYPQQGPASAPHPPGRGCLSRAASNPTLSLTCANSNLAGVMGQAPAPSAAPAPLYSAPQLAAAARQPPLLRPGPGSLLPRVPSVSGGFTPAPVCLTTCLNQAIDPQLDALCHALLKQMRQLDSLERAARGTPTPPGGIKVPRRLVGGLREVRKAVKSGTAAVIVSAVDIQEMSPCVRCATQPGAEITEICQLAAAHGIPVVFALTRVGLGSIFGANKRMSAVALTNVSGLEAQTQRMLQFAAVARARFALMARNPHLF